MGRPAHLVRAAGSLEELAAQGVVEAVALDRAEALAFSRCLGFAVEMETPAIVALRRESTFLFVARDFTVRDPAGFETRFALVIA